MKIPMRAILALYSAMRACALAASIALSSGAIAHGAPTPTKVAVEAGTIQGAVGDGVLRFKGIPYAAPPVGDLRWRPPQPVKPWSGVLRARAFGPDCLQRAHATYNFGRIL